MIRMVHPSPALQGVSPSVRTAEPGRALAFPLAEQRSRRRDPGPGGSTAGPGLVSASDSGMALPPWKLLSEMLLSLRTGGPA